MAPKRCREGNEKYIEEIQGENGIKAAAVFPPPLPVAKWRAGNSHGLGCKPFGLAVRCVVHPRTQTSWWLRCGSYNLQSRPAFALAGDCLSDRDPETGEPPNRLEKPFVPQ